MVDIYLNSKENPEFESFFLYDELTPIEILPNFNTINLLIGANNSGKSRFMRGLMRQQEVNGGHSFRNLFQKLSRYVDLLKSINITWMKKPGDFGTRSVNQLYDKYTSFTIQPPAISNQILFNGFDDTQLSNYLQMLIDIREIGNQYLSRHFVMQDQTAISFSYKYEEELDELIELNKQITKGNKLLVFGTKLNYFIPTMRTAHSLFKDHVSTPLDSTSVSSRTFSKQSPYIFFDTIVKNYKFGALATREPVNHDTKSKRVYIFTGLDLYHQIVNARNGSKEQRKRFDSFEKFLSRSFWNEDPIDIVALFNIDEKNRDVDENELINITIGSENQHLHDLGDGVQSLIILMYSIFLAPDHTIIFIDEPELNLHPGMQRLFLEQITTNPALTDKKLHYVIATHSNHLLDLTLEKDNVSIYSFSRTKENRSIIKNVNVGDNELLRELGVNNSSVFLANSSIWVEGISDRNYIKAFLTAYCNEKNVKHPKEDIDFAFLEYAGSNLIHYDFTDVSDKDKVRAFALNNRIFILADMDEKKEDKHKKYEELAVLNKENLCYSTTEPYREIENMLSAEVWKYSLIEFCNKRQVAEVRDAIQKVINERIDSVNIEDYAGAYIGNYLEKLGISQLNTIYDRGTDVLGTLKSEIKTSLSSFVLKGVVEGKITWTTLAKNSHVEQLTVAILNFINKTSNKDA